MATKGLYVRRGIKKEPKSYRKFVILLAVLFAFGVLISPLLWKKSRSKHLTETSSVTSKIDTEGRATTKGSSTGQTVVTGKIPKTAPITVAQQTPTPGGALSEDKEKLDVRQTPPPPSPSSGEISSQASSGSLPSASSTQVVGKQQSPYELRSELQAKEAEADKKAKEVVAQGALKEIPFPAGSSGGTPSAGSGGKHTIVSLLGPEGGKKQETKPGAEKSSPKPAAPVTPPKGKASAVTKPQQEASVSSSAVKPAERETTASSSTSNREASYWIQVGAYREEANAKKVKSLIDSLGYEAIVKPSSHPRLGTIYIVRVPVKGSKAEAQKALSVISQKTGDKPFLMESR